MTENSDATAVALSQSIARPALGGATRVRLGRGELVLERGRGGYSLLWSDGRQARRYMLGLHERGTLTLAMRAPKHAVRLMPRDALTLVPGARLRGYVTVPLVPTVVWQADGCAPECLIELHQEALQAEWCSETEQCLFRCGASWLVRFPYPSGEAQAVVPVVLKNESSEVVSPGHLDVAFSDDDLQPLRNSLVLQPRRIVWPALAEPTDTKPSAPIAADPRASGDDQDRGSDDRSEGPQDAESVGNDDSLPQARMDSDATKPVLGQPILAQPRMTDPVLASPTLANPIAADPIATHPTATNQSIRRAADSFREDAHIASALARTRELHRANEPGPQEDRS